PGLERGDDPVAREDARRRALDLLAAPYRQAVPAPFPARLGVLSPVRLGVDARKRRRPVVVLHGRHSEVGVEVRAELRELHRTDSRAALNSCRVVSPPSTRSPCRSTRPSTVSMVNASGSSCSFTSSQRSGVETGAPG